MRTKITAIHWDSQGARFLTQFGIDTNRERQSLSLELTESVNGSFLFHICGVTITSNFCLSVLKVFVWMSPQVKHDVQHHIPSKDLLTNGANHQSFHCQTSPSKLGLIDGKEEERVFVTKSDQRKG
jgi:hypothetical protein